MIVRPGLGTVNVGYRARHIIYVLEYIFSQRLLFYLFQYRYLCASFKCAF